VEKGTHQTHLLLGTRSYPANDERRTALYLLNNMLGGPGMNSRLNLSLRERRGLVYSVESNLVSYTDTGTFSVYFGCDSEDALRCRQLVQIELNKLCLKPLTETQLKAAKKQIIGQIAVASDNFENVALEMGKSFLHYRKFEPQESVFQRILALTPQQLQEVAKEMFTPDRMSMLMFR
jgi:predicted Zn-dependent peptidase